MKAILGFAVAKLRTAWRQLTSMRTALVLLFLLAVASIPGSILPQQGVNPEKINQYFVEHPDLAPIIDKLGGFDVFRSPWFAAIYLLLFTSLIGCILPRTRDHARALLRRVPDAPKRLTRLPEHHRGRTEHGAKELATALRGWRTVTREHPDGTVTIAAEKGFLKETGNLVFHTALIGVLVGVALGSMQGWHANRLLVKGPEQAFCTTPQQFDEYVPGTGVNPSDLPKYCLELTDFQASYLDNGQAKSFGATVAVTGEKTETTEFSVNHPLRLGDANVYLLGHGYAVILRYTDTNGRSQTAVVPFLPTDQQTLTSEGVATFPDANADPKTGKPDRTKQVAFSGLYVPTAPDSGMAARSIYPEERNPRLVLTFYQGDLGIDQGVPSSVYRLNSKQIANGKLKQIGDGKSLEVNGSWTLDDGSKLEFLGTRPFVTVSLRHDPGEPVVLVSILLVLAGLMLSLGGKRRRVWVRLTPSDDGTNLLEIGGLPRSEYPGFAAEFAAVVAKLGITEMGDDTREPVDALR
ncbi:cytochrome c biogenesis protein ResB [Hamadaea sp. NPDC050747]|uniref:cytochrome c biogenesis protein ResB n=1 Tax=Hamadaea sp. NPDC050747 TaxID=3155789 RepID=UPI0033F69955